MGFEGAGEGVDAIGVIGDEVVSLAEEECAIGGGESGGEAEWGGEGVLAELMGEGGMSEVGAEELFIGGEAEVEEEGIVEEAEGFEAAHGTVEEFVAEGGFCGIPGLFDEGLDVGWWLEGGVDEGAEDVFPGEVAEEAEPEHGSEDTVGRVIELRFKIPMLWGGEREGGCWMFGNALGWLISLVMVALAGVFLVILGSQGDISPPGRVGARAANWTGQLTVEPSSLASYMVEPIDPGPMYAEAISLYEAERHELRRVERVTSTKSAEAERWSKIMGLLLRAGKSSRPVVFGANPGEVIGYDTEGRLEAIRAIGSMGIRLALLHSAEKEKGKAREYAEAVFALGSKMYTERLCFGEYMVAHGMLGEAALLLAQLAEEGGDGSRAARYRDFDAKRVAFFTKEVDPVRRAVMVLDPYPGDMFALADRASEVMWRVEAILALGRLKYSAERYGDQQGALAVVAGLSGSGDPRIRAAAIAARDLTVEQFRKLH